MAEAAVRLVPSCGTAFLARHTCTLLGEYVANLSVLAQRRKATSEQFANFQASVMSKLSPNIVAYCNKDREQIVWKTHDISWVLYGFALQRSVSIREARAPGARRGTEKHLRRRVTGSRQRTASSYRSTRALSRVWLAPTSLGRPQLQLSKSSQP